MSNYRQRYFSHIYTCITIVYTKAFVYSILVMILIQYLKNKFFVDSCGSHAYVFVLWWPSTDDGRDRPGPTYGGQIYGSIDSIASVVCGNCCSTFSRFDQCEIFAVLVLRALVSHSCTGCFAESEQHSCDGEQSFGLKTYP
jgi:hypothetical protein